MSIVFLGKEIPLYGLFFFIGVFVAGGIAALICKKRGIAIFDLVSSAVFTMIFAIVGAKLLFVIVSMDYIIEVFNIEGLSITDKIGAVLNGGFVFYGGFIGGFAGLVVYCKAFKEKLWKYLDIYATVLPLGHAFGRVGCFFGGCCYGMPYDGIFSYTYEGPLIGKTPIGVPLFPVQLFEAGCLVLIFAAMMVIFFKTKEKYHLTVFGYLASYCVVRFVLEFFRGDKERGGAFFLSTSQIISILIALFTAGYILWSVWLKDKIMAKKACACGEAESEKSLGESDSEK